MRTCTSRMVHRGRGALSALAIGAAFAGLLTGAALAGTAAKNEAPALAAQVKAGKLPPLAERLPKEPLVVKPVEAVGTYGGTLRSLISGAGDFSWFRTMFGYDQLLIWDIKAENAVPNLALSVEASPDAKTYTFKLREGLRWSDGTPFTSKDILFWWNDVFAVEQMPPQFKPRFIREGAKTRVEAPDDYTVKFSFDKPYALFPLQMATPDGDVPVMFPAHYLKQFHIKYNPDADKQAKSAGLIDWVDLFTRKADQWNNPEKPTIFAWKIERPLSDVQRVTLSRNPYYWKIDTAGNQLPYIDSISHEVVADKEVMLLKALAGEIDFIGRYVNTLANKPVLVENENRAKIKFFEIVDATPNYMQVHINQTNPDPVLREIFSNKDFRIGLSHALDRQAIIDLIFAGQGEPYQIAPRPESEFYDKEFGKQFTEYSVEKANKYLDKVVPNKDAQGFRLRPDGKRLSFVITVREDRQPMVDTAPLVADYWRKVGLDVQFRAMEKTAYLNQRNSNQHQALIDDGDGGMLDAMLLPRAYVPINPDGAWGTGWINWVMKANLPKAEPPERIQAVLTIYDKMLAAPDTKTQKDIYRELLRAAKDNFNSMGIGLPVPFYGATTRRVHNVAEPQIWSSWVFAYPGPSVPAQYFIKD